MRFYRGWTLVELLISLSLFAIFSLFSLAYLPSLYKKNQLQSRRDELKQALSVAKTEALMRGETLILTPLSNTKDWSTGMLLFVDNSAHAYTPTTALIHKWQWPLAGVTMAWHGFQSNHYVLFAKEMTERSSNGYFSLSNALQQQVTLVINRLGRVREGDNHVNETHD